MEREKGRKKNQLLTEAAEMFDLPADVVAGLRWRWAILSIC